MITFHQALSIVLKNTRPLERETVNLENILSKVLAQDIYAPINIPPFDNSAMDGFALRAEDTQNASSLNPIKLKIIEDIPAGYAPKKILKSSQASRIMTGAVMPKGADSVVIMEEAKVKLEIRNTKYETNSKSKIQNSKQEYAEVSHPVKLGDNVRRKGEDVKKGSLVFKKGTFIRSAQLGLLASLGFQTIEVIKTPKISFLVTGDEIADINSKDLPLGKIRNSNSYALWAQLVENGAMPNNLGLARDNLKELKSKIKKGLKSDILLVCGGVSVGKYDFVQQALEDLGVKILFWRVKIRPGKPVLFGIKGRTIIFGIPGNPVSSYMIFEQFIRPAILKMKGIGKDYSQNITAIITEKLKKPQGLRYFVRGFTWEERGKYFTRPLGPHGSAILSSLARANSIIILPEKIKLVKKHQKVELQLLHVFR